jgi:hypothetical protein
VPLFLTTLSLGGAVLALCHPALAHAVAGGVLWGGGGWQWLGWQWMWLIVAVILGLK